MESLNGVLEKYKYPIILSFIGLVLIIGGIFSSGIIKGNKAFPKESLVDIKPASQVKVDLSGAVKKPAVYSLNVNSRVEDVVNLAGGFSENVNKEYISKYLNLSAKLADGQKIYIPFEGENFGATGGVAGVKINSKVGINSSSQSQLEDLPGVGPATAEKIISGRPYSDIAELTSKKIISKAVFEKIKELIDIN
ncbi:ComEA family DNA-binding protein [Candidatus Daviesbacteria bacterium]|nr:ComEA family DNA-binding protein [Candidatus Daviesbacteria bacterium]